MTAFHNILVGLDFSTMDTHLLEHLPLYAAGEESPNLHFLHVNYAGQFPVLVGDRYQRLEPDPSASLVAMESMISEVQPRLDLGHFNTSFKVLEGTITRQLLAYANDSNIDLTIMGRKKHPAGTGVAAHRYLRGSEGSVLFVPEHRSPEMNKVLVATDFSDYSVAVINKTVDLLLQQPETPELHLVNVFDVPTDLAYRISRTEGQFSRIIRENVESVVPDFLKRIDFKGIPHKMHLIENTRYNSAQHLIDFADTIDTDLMVIGARGHSIVSALLLGSVAERVLRYNDRLPLLVIRCEKDVR